MHKASRRNTSFKQELREILKTLYKGGYYDGNDFISDSESHKTAESSIIKLIEEIAPKDMEGNFNPNEMDHNEIRLRGFYQGWNKYRAEMLESLNRGGK